jgi:hypothetical protein
MTPHILARNCGPARPAVYFRIGQYDRPGEPAFTDVFSSWPGLQSAAAAYASR